MAGYAQGSVIPSMWRLILYLYVTLLCLSCHAGDIRVTTWNLGWFPSGSPKPAAPEQEAENITAAARLLKTLNPDVIVLQEVRDETTCERLAAEIEPGVYTLQVCSRFKEAVGGGLSAQQVAIISKNNATEAWSERWKSVGAVDPPRGFAYAVFARAEYRIRVYSVHLKSNVERHANDRQLNLVKRELAIKQLLTHAQETSMHLTNTTGCVVIAGDLNTNADQAIFLPEKTLGLLEEAGFRSGFESQPLPSRVTHPGSGRYPDATFDYIFTKGAAGDAPIITTSSVSDHRPVTRILRLP